MNTTILPMRHGQTPWNREGRFRGREDLPLDEYGQWQSLMAGTAIAHRCKPTVAYTSPLVRAQQTASAIAQLCGCRVQEHPGLIDIDYGQWQGMSQAAAQQVFPDAHQLWLSSPGDARPPGGESLGAVAERSSHALQELTADHPHQAIVLVAHTVINRLLLCCILGLPLSSFWRLRQDTACLNVFEWDGQHFTLSELNSTCHRRRQA